MRTARMSRSRSRIIAGVCAGFAEHTGLPVGMVRAGAVVLTVLGGGGALLYLWLWATVPAAPPAPEPRRRDLAAQVAAGTTGGPGQKEPTGRPADWAASAGFAAVLAGAGLLVIAGILIANRLGAQIPVAVVVPLIVVALGVALAWQQVGELLPGAASLPAARRYANVIGAIGLVAAGILLLFTSTEAPSVGTMFGAAIAVLLAVLLALAPWLVRLTRELAEEREARARETERGAIAAHLHDSVLQTLAVIQQKAAPHSDVARIARAQERELRDWLYADANGADAATPGDLAAQLTGHASRLEADYPVAFEVVVVGQMPECEMEAFSGACREAMTNAAKHAGGTVSVSIEAGIGALRADVVDRGPGFDVDAVPSDRHGVRGSILTRMRQAGGEARFSPGPGGSGTAVTLTLPVVPRPDPTANHPEGVRS